MSDKEMADFLRELSNRHEMPIDEDEYYLLRDIADRMIELSEQERVDYGFSMLDKITRKIQEYHDRCRDNNMRNHTCDGITITFDPHTLSWLHYWLMWAREKYTSLDGNTNE